MVVERCSSLNPLDHPFFLYSNRSYTTHVYQIFYLYNSTLERKSAV